MDNRYTSFELMEIFNIKKGSWYNLKKQLRLDDYSEKVVENNRPKFLYNEQAFELLKEKFNISFDNEKIRDKNNGISIYQEQIIDMYKKENEYLKQENKMLLDIIAVKEQKEFAKDFKSIGSGQSFWDNLFSRFKKK